MPPAKKEKEKEQRNRGQIIPKGDGRWLVRFYAGRDVTGKRQYPAKLVEGTYLQAQKELTKLQGQQDTGTYVAPTKVSLKEYLLGTAKDFDNPEEHETTGWLGGKLNLSAKTRREYKARMEKDVIPVLGHLRLENITALHIQNLVAGMQKRGLSPRTLEYTHTILSQSFSFVVRSGLLPRNPAQYIELPKKDEKPPVIFSPAQASLFLEKAAEIESPWYTLWVVLLTAGVRPQEALALQWSEVDLDNWGTLRVTRALVEVKPGVYEIGPVKTKKGVRAIGIPEGTVNALRGHRFRLGVISGLVFPNAVGSHYDLSRVRKAWYKDLASVNVLLATSGQPLLPEPKLYGARHSHITHLLMANVHPKVASGRAGHSSTAITMETYSHVLPEVDQEAGKKIGELLFRVAK